MRQNHFHVSAKTIDDTLLFPKTFNGENFLLQSVIESAQSFGVITKCYSSFPTGFEVLALCDSQEQAKISLTRYVLYCMRKTTIWDISLTVSASTLLM
jgi:hypothetical protein